MDTKSRSGRTGNAAIKQPSALAPRDPVARALRMLAAMVDLGADTYGVRQLAELSGTAPSTVHRVLTGLEQAGLVTRTQKGAYKLGLEFYRLAWKGTSGYTLRRAALPVLQELVAACNETALLGVYDPLRRRMVFAAAIESLHLLRYVMPLNEWIPIQAASGLAVMAFLSDDEKAAINSEGVHPLTSRTIRNPTALDNELRRIRERGYALSKGQRIPGAVGIAAPIWGPEGRVVGEVTLVIPEQRFDASAETHLADRVKQAAAQIASRIGGGSSIQGDRTDRYGTSDV